MANIHSIQQQIDEANREICMRQDVYRRRVAKGAMRQAEADYGIAAMTAIRDTLVWCRDNRALIPEVKKRLEAQS